ncbi:hypothetical protein Z969_10740 [Clostridium novyi A str. 4570]|uniref:UvrD-like helicase ATP-binding domain-containing protein n=2 Tax=Clostridium novyi TaxID=1542 RepID=A0AA88ZSY2_CLONO|nr:hypothetical protein Z969_10740 [Clostridium novyi A str. 4570]
MDKIDPIMSKDRFIGIYNVYSRGNNINKNFPAMMVWEEIRGIWKSNILNGASNIMSFEEYKNLSEEVAPNFKDNRNEAYKIFIWYQNYLKENNMLDEIDMIEEYLTFENNENYSIVACDEIQDLTNMHFKLISSLCNNEPQRMLIAGDDHQIVNHSGFRWQNISNTLYKNYKCKAKISVLNTNFRNTGSIVNLANSINKLQEKFTEYRYKGTTKQSSFTGEIPKLLKNIDEECIIDKLSNLGPTQAIIVRNEQELLRLNEIFYKTFNKTPLIFTIEQVKGLEFNTVVLWRINTTLEDTKIFWQKFVRNISNNVINNNVNERCIRYESSLLYVAITRGMKKCLIYDGNEYSPVWNIKDINSNLNVINSIEDLMDKDDEVEYTEYDWFKQGKVLLNKRLYTQALQCFLRVDQSIGSDEIKKLIIKCKAEIEIENGNLEKAADLYLAMGYHEEAAECYDNAGLYDKAANIYFTKKYCSDPYPLYRRYKSKYFDSIKEWYRSAIYCKQNKDYYEAMIRYERAGRIKDAQNIQQKYLQNI